MSGHPTKDQVRQANRRFYDLAAQDYEAIDGRRSQALSRWLTGRLTGLRELAPGGALLDLGAGAGLVSRCARGVFSRRFALDISSGVLAAHRDAFDGGVCGDVEALPLCDGCLDAIMAFATLHHLYEFEGLVREAARVLRPGGVFCSDHDMDAAFHDRFRLPLALYRRLRGAGARYVRSVAGLTGELYALSEHQEGGIDAGRLAGLLAAAGFEVRLEHHWYGLTPVTDRLFGASRWPRGLAPLVRVVAVKPAHAPAPAAGR